MAVISDVAIATAARNAGIPGDQIAIAVAIALAESGGDTMAHNTRPPDNSYGLWQINMLGSLGPDRRKKLNISSNDQLFNPETNAKAAALISNGGKSWRAWTTFTRGTYLRYLNRGKQAAANQGSTTATTPVTSTTSLGKLGSLISDSAVYRKAGLYLLGALLILLGLVLLFRIQKLIPAGKAVKAIKAVK